MSPWKKGEDLHQHANSDSRTPSLLQLLSKFSILKRESVDVKLKIIEKLLIARGRPDVNKAVS